MTASLCSFLVHVESLSEQSFKKSKGENEDFLKVVCVTQLYQSTKILIL